MLTVGFYLAQVSLRELFTDKNGYAVSAVRLLIIPLLTVILLAILPIGNYDLKLTVIILAAAPIGSNAAVYAQLYGGDYKRAVREIVLSTLLSAVLFPDFFDDIGNQQRSRTHLDVNVRSLRAF